MLKWGGRVYPPELRPSQHKASGTCSLRLHTRPVAPIRSPFQGRGFWSTKPDTTHWSSFGCTGLHRHPLSSAGNKGGGAGGSHHCQWGTGLCRSLSCRWGGAHWVNSNAGHAGGGVCTCLAKEVNVLIRILAFYQSRFNSLPHPQNVTICSQRKPPS